jgi:hypothetical protein
MRPSLILSTFVTCAAVAVTSLVAPAVASADQTAQETINQLQAAEFLRRSQDLTAVILAIEQLTDSDRAAVRAELEARAERTEGGGYALAGVCLTTVAS